MHKKTLFGAVVAAAALTAGGFALAQSNAVPPSSTPGAGCTATANAMRGGNLGGSPSSTACAPGSTNAAAAPAPASPSAATATAPTATATMGATADTSTSRTSATSANASETGPSAPAPRRVARADRN